MQLVLSRVTTESLLMTMLLKHYNLKVTKRARQQKSLARLQRVFEKQL